MKSYVLQLAVNVFVLSAMSTSAAIRFVDLNSASPTPPYTDWTTAASTIQDAVDAAVAGDQILVTNGVYQTGGRVASGTNRVAVTKPVTVQSVNGAAVTEIKGDHETRCAYLINGAALVGFTLIGGAAINGGGVWCESASAVVSNCTLTANSARQGGGAYGGTLFNCTLTSNSSSGGGSPIGGGAYNCTLNNCTLARNSAAWLGGGASGSALNNCTLSGNSAADGGGADNSVLNNCMLTGNSAGSEGGGAVDCMLNNCTLTGNSANEGGGAYSSTLNNCIVYYNSAPNGDNYSGSILNYSCTTPLPADGIGNLTNAPLFLDQAGGNLRLQSNSPCINAGSNPFAPAGLDLDGNPRIVGGTVDMGAYEFPSPQSNISSIRYVNVHSASPNPPYTDWTTAASTIQDAVDAAVAGDQILVTNGVYQTGGRVASGTNRVAVTKPVTVQSVNGAAVTEIKGDHETRCVYLTNGAALVGFTLIGGAAINGGGVWCESVSAVVSNCTLTANSARQGGGAYGGTLNNCTLTANSSLGEDTGGGAASSCTLNNCLLTGNSAFYYGGGALGCKLNNCTLSGNSAAEGGGALGCTLNNCLLKSNSAIWEGGGVSRGTLNNCTLTANSAASGGGAKGGTLNNCIVYYNSALNGANYSDSSLSYSCTTPLPADGVGNISAEPQLASASQLSAGSPCRGAGSAAYARGLDINGEIWSTPPSIGCDEYHPDALTGLLAVSIQAVYRNAAVGFVVNFTAAIDGHATANRWDFGDGTVVSNRLYASHSWAVAGDYSLVLQAYNDTYPGGISATLVVHVAAQPVHYVAMGSANPVPPYSSWTTAAQNIQDAVDAASFAGALVLVTNGVYQTGGREVIEGGLLSVLNRVAVTKAITVRSVNGAAATLIQGAGVRCVSLTDGSALVGFTLTNGTALVNCSHSKVCTSTSGGGVWCGSGSALVSNCVLTANWAPEGGGAWGCTLKSCILTGNSADDGGGASACSLNNCALTGNSASYFGGGASDSTLNNCALAGNSATNGRGGGAWECALNNCIAYYNSAPDGANHSDATLSYSCTTPLPADGTGNLTNAPLFLDQAGGNLRLQSNSPCINAGSNPFAPAGPDLDGNPRIVGGAVDIGAYEFQSPQSLISYAWLRQYDLPTDGSADFADTDADGLNNWQEWRAGTDPANALSGLRLLIAASGGTGGIVSWQSVSGRNYFLERSTDLGARPQFLPLASGIVGQPGTTTFTDTNEVGAGPFFYRVGVRE